jgi:lipoprotein NlpI
MTKLGLLFAALVLPIGSIGVSACAQSAPPAQVLASCLDAPRDDRALRLAACTAAIGTSSLSAQDRALAYNNRGEAHCGRGEYDEALADQEEAIRLKPGFAQAFIDKASCHIGKQDVEAAFADYDQGIALAPRVPGYYRQRAQLYNWIGEHERALQDYDKAISLAPRFNEAMDERANALFELGRFGEAARQLVTVIQLTPGDPYPVLWLHIARLRAGAPDEVEFQRGIRTLDLKGWPGPLFDLFLGKTTLEAMRQRGYEVDDPREGECEGAVFGAQYDLAKGDIAAATQLLEEAVSVCYDSENQYLISRADLARLNPAVRDGSHGKAASKERGT